MHDDEIINRLQSQPEKQVFKIETGHMNYDEIADLIKFWREQLISHRHDTSLCTWIPVSYSGDK